MLIERRAFLARLISVGVAAGLPLPLGLPKIVGQPETADIIWEAKNAKYAVIRYAVIWSDEPVD